MSSPRRCCVPSSACRSSSGRARIRSSAGALDVSDPVGNLEFQFLGLGTPGCLAALDTNADGALDLRDPVFSLEHQFLGRPAPPPPYPGCGPESLGEEEALPCEKGPESCR